MFIDEAKIYVRAGKGGHGCNSRFRTKFNRIGRPDGGPGGDGGDVVIEADTNVHTLLDFQYRQHFEAASGGHGSSNHKKGARGEDRLIRVPPGTQIKDYNTHILFRDLVWPGNRVIIARGGKGGRGNSRGRDAEKGVSGEEKTLLLEMKLIADVGIVGHPNAGKSTLITKISHAQPKIANYPFTTREPVLGVVKVRDDSMVVAEIPGLIEGAHTGRGLGDKFLRHLERTKVLIFLIDAAAQDGRDPLNDHDVLDRELKLFSKELAKKHKFIAMNKTDDPNAETHIGRFRERYPRRKIFRISAATGKGVDELMGAVIKKIRG
jgi:GTP-binding protein